MKAKRNKVTSQVSTMGVVQSSPFTGVNNHDYISSSYLERSSDQ